MVGVRGQAGGVRGHVRGQAGGVRGQAGGVRGQAGEGQRSGWWVRSLDGGQTASAL